VRDGEVLHVTDRNAIVAEIRPVEARHSDEREVLRALEASDLVSVGSGRYARHEPARLRGRVRASRVVLEDRR
jgi:antitoxin (DNA-binding transcriptional repressor) of toxin-antitoxin stability system